jgi:restriction system protein
MKNYYRVMLGRGSKHADECFKGNFIGVDFNIEQDLSRQLHENWRDFNKEFIPYLLKKEPGKSRISAGLACGAVWTVSKGINIGDLVLCPNGIGSYYVGEVTSNYTYQPDGILPHRRNVKWFTRTIDRSMMSDALRHSTGAIGTVSQVAKHAKEIEELIVGTRPPTIISTDDNVEDPSEFAIEKHLEDFLVQNWKQTEIGKKYDIYEEDGELVGQQYQSDTGPIDILAISKDKKELLVVELKKGKASDTVVGQVQRYMGYALEELAEENQKVKGVIIAAEDDIRIRRALAVTNNIEFYCYQVSFKLFKNEKKQNGN